MTTLPSSTTGPVESPAILWATAFVRALAAGGLTAVCISPGSRSTPLAFAFQAEPHIHATVHLDERSAAFFALGLALAKREPVALLCTSGTAGANYFPAIIEANMSEIPLLLLTADRPPELRHSGANQTIDQVKLFGDQVLWAVDMALPEADAPPAAWRNLERTAVRALARANGLRKGPVHLNFPFRKPLEPADPAIWPPPEEARRPRPSLSAERGLLAPTSQQAAWLRDLMQAHPRGLIVAGPLGGGQDLAPVLGRLAALSGYPILADPLSGLRYGEQVPGATVCSAYENYLHRPITNLEPDLILRLGAMPTSQRLAGYLERQETTVQVHIRESGTWADEAHVVTHFLQVNPGLLAAALSERLDMAVDTVWVERWQALEAISAAAITELVSERVFDGAYVATLLDDLPPSATLLAGNSLPIRHVDQFGRGPAKTLAVYGNRGASGIDGNISTGMGLAAAADGPAVILVGDITFYHDSNGLLAVRSLPLDNVTIVLLNNNGGGIFQRLPVSQFEPLFRDYFQTPHHLDFAAFAAAYGLHYHQAADLPDFRAALARFVGRPGSTLIEVRTNAEDDLRQRAALEAQIWRDIQEYC